MSTTLAPQNPLSYMGVKPPRPPNVITENRAPTTLDTNYDLGTMWVDTTTPQVYFLAEVSGNTATWLPLGGGGTGVHTLTGNSGGMVRSEEHTSELQSRENLVCRLLLE